jgi:hypothetical protein
MSSGTKIITKAFKRLGVFTVFNIPPNEAIIEGMERLNGMLDSWRTKFVNIPFNELTVPGQELGEPVDATNTIIDNLAINLAPDYDGTETGNVSPTLIRNARVGLINLKRAYRCQPIPQFTLSSTTPVGQGNQDGLFNLSVFWGVNRPKGG